MKIMSLWQPYATFIELGLKQHETRHWATSYTGDLLIHAAKRKLTRTEVQELKRSLAPLKDASPAIDEIIYDFEGWIAKLPYGRLVAKTELTDCLPMSQRLSDRRTIAIEQQTLLERSLGNWKPGRYAWDLPDVASPRDCDSDLLNVVGQQGLFAASVEVIEVVSQHCMKELSHV